MKRVPPVAKQEKASLRGRDLATVQEIARRLLRQATDDSQSAPRHDLESGGKTVLLEGDVDGVHYLFVRMQVEPSYGRSLFTPREQEIARLVAKGHPNKVIGAIIGISTWTVCTHLRRMFAKIGVGSRAALVARLLEEGSLREQPSGENQVSPLIQRP